MLADNLQGLEKNFNDLLCPVLKGFVMGKARYPRYFEDFQFSDDKDASKMLSEIVSRIADEKLPPLYILIDEYDNFTNQLLTSFNDTLYEEVTTGDSFLRTFFKVIKGGIGEGAIRTCFCTGVLPVTMDDLTSGRITFHSIFTSPAPSIFADSISSLGTPSIACLMMKTPKAVGSGKIRALNVLIHPNPRMIR